MMATFPPRMRHRECVRSLRQSARRTEQVGRKRPTRLRVLAREACSWPMPPNESAVARPLNLRSRSTRRLGDGASRYEKGRPGRTAFLKPTVGQIGTADKLAISMDCARRGSSLSGM